MYHPTPPLSVVASTVRNFTSRSLLLRGVFIVLVLAWFALSQTARAVLPVPDGGYGNNTAEGTDALFSLTTGSANTALGFQALFSNKAGSANTATGDNALQNNTTGNDNTANGFFALSSNTTGGNNTADGVGALQSNTTGNENTANGVAALLSNTTGADNTATGFRALYGNTTGSNNTASGFEALFSNTTGFNNTASGYQALLGNTSGFNNSANGVSALLSNTTGFHNTADGFTALQNNTTGNSNTAAGDGALASNTTGSFNTAGGISALLNNTIGKNNIGLGSNAGANLTTGNNNIAVGSSAGLNLTTGSNNIDIGALGVAGDAGKIRIGKQGIQNGAFIAGVYGKTVASGTKVAVMIDSTGKLGTVVSSARFKDDIKPMDKASEAILELKPVTFRYKRELDPDGGPQFGLVAEQVEKVNPDLVVRDEDGKVNTVRYEAVNAMLLNEFLKEHRKVQEQAATIAQLKKGIGVLTARLDEQDSKIQKVSAQLAVSKAAPQTVLNNQ